MDAHFLSFCILVEEMHRASGRACPLRAMGSSMERNSQNVFLASRLLSWPEPPESISFTVLWATGSLESVFLGVEKQGPMKRSEKEWLLVHLVLNSDRVPHSPSLLRVFSKPLASMPPLRSNVENKVFESNLRITEMKRENESSIYDQTHDSHFDVINIEKTYLKNICLEPNNF